MALTDTSTVDEHGVHWYTIDGKEHFNEEQALAVLLQAGELFANSRRYLGLEDEPYPETIVLFVICNDVFAWGCADAEELPLHELVNLYKMWRAEKGWGTTKWCCKRRNQKPQGPVEKKMREVGKWDAMMDGLRANDYWKEKATP